MAEGILMQEQVHRGTMQGRGVSWEERQFQNAKNFELASSLGKLAWLWLKPLGIKLGMWHKAILIYYTITLLQWCNKYIKKKTKNKCLL